MTHYNSCYCFDGNLDSNDYNMMKTMGVLSGTTKRSVRRLQRLLILVPIFL